MKPASVGWVTYWYLVEFLRTGKVAGSVFRKLWFTVEVSLHPTEPKVRT